MLGSQSRLDEIVTVGPSTNVNPLQHQNDVELGHEKIKD